MSERHLGLVDARVADWVEQVRDAKRAWRAMKDPFRTPPASYDEYSAAWAALSAARSALIEGVEGLDGHDDDGA